MIRRDPIFLGCTRPPLFLGVPAIPFFIGAGTCMLLALYLHFGLLVLLPMVLLVMRRMTARDDMIFRLLGMQWRMFALARNRALRGGDISFAPAPMRRLPRAARP